MTIAVRADRLSHPVAAQRAGLLVLALALTATLVASDRRHAALHLASTPDGGAPVSIATIGFATYYGAGFDGGRMANGVRFNMDDPTIAAANSWPLGTKLLVRRITGSPWDDALTPAERARYIDHAIVVTVTDRGAFSHALDLSQAAFAQLARLDEGVIRVEVQPLPDATPPASSGDESAAAAGVQ